ncbi:hypothetical protein AX17_001575 [Amanita inopinata Kibby_2008]|nr:hypothetical protein AX17_001575 [Amanita inopinata Kibby_2008]
MSFSRAHDLNLQGCEFNDIGGNYLENPTLNSYRNSSYAREFNGFGGNYLENPTVNVYSISGAANRPTSPPPVHIKNPSPFFVGRENYLTTLKNHFIPPTAEGLPVRMSFLLHGMGGVGKTQICLKFIQDTWNQFSHVFWIDASSETTITHSLQWVAKNQGFQFVSATSVLHWLSRLKDDVHWLMVFDNADSGHELVERFIPPGNRGNILITSRNKSMGRVVSFQNSVEVHQLEEEEALKLLVNAGNLDIALDHVLEAARKIVDELHCFPLALDQAGAYMQATPCDPVDYLDLYHKHHKEMMSHPEFKGASDYGRTAYGTWDISIQAIERMASKGDPKCHAAQSALILHKLFAFFHYEDIAEEIMKRAAENYQANISAHEKVELPHSTSLLDPQTLHLDEAGEWDVLHFQSGIRMLISFSLIKATRPDLYSIHPLVHVWSYERLSKEEMFINCHKARALLSCSLLPERKLLFALTVVPHLKTNLNLSQQLHIKEEYFHDVYSTFSHIFYVDGEFEKAGWMAERHLNELKSRLGKEHYLTVASMTKLAAVYRNSKGWEEAEILLLEALKMWRIEYGSQCHYTLWPVYMLASVYNYQGKFHEAEKLQSEAVEEHKELLGLGHRSTLKAIEGLAQIYSQQERWDEAEKLLQQVLKKMKLYFRVKGGGLKQINSIFRS